MSTTKTEQLQKELADKYGVEHLKSHALSSALSVCGKYQAAWRLLFAGIATLTIIHGAVQKENQTLQTELKQAQQTSMLLKRKCSS